MGAAIQMGVGRNGQARDAKRRQRRHQKKLKEFAEAVGMKFLWRTV